MDGGPGSGGSGSNGNVGIPPAIIALGAEAVSFIFNLIKKDKKSGPTIKELLPDYVAHGIRLWQGEFAKVTFIFPVPASVYPVEWITNTVLNNYKDWERMENLLKNRGREDGNRFKEGSLTVPGYTPVNDPLTAGLGENTGLLIVGAAMLAGFLIFK